MTTDRKLKISFGLISFVLLTTLLFKLTNVPGGIILSGLFLGGMIIVGIILGCLILTGILRLFLKRTSFLTLLFITTTIAFLAFHYQLYSPTLTIKVPNGYKGEINLVLSNFYPATFFTIDVYKEGLHKKKPDSILKMESGYSLKKRLKSA